MKKHIILSAFLAVALASCSNSDEKEEMAQELADINRVSMSFTTGYESYVDCGDEMLSKINMNASQELIFNASDLFKVYSVLPDGTLGSKGDLFSNTNEEDGKTACITGTVKVENQQADFYALYPYDNGAFDGKIFSQSIESNQNAEVGMFDPHSACFSAYTNAEDLHFDFKAAFSLIKIEFPFDTKYTRAVIESKGQPLTGKFNYTMNGKEIASITPNGGGNSVTLNAKEGSFKKGTYYAIVLPGTYDDITITLEYKSASGQVNENTRVLGSSATFNRAKIKGLSSSKYITGEKMWTSVKLDGKTGIQYGQKDAKGNLMYMSDANAGASDYAGSGNVYGWNSMTYGGFNESNTHSSDPAKITMGGAWTTAEASHYQYILGNSQLSFANNIYTFTMSNSSVIKFPRTNIWYTEMEEDYDRRGNLLSRIVAERITQCPYKGDSFLWTKSGTSEGIVVLLSDELEYCDIISASDEDFGVAYALDKKSVDFPASNVGLPVRGVYVNDIVK